jgi:hypothetical protein
MGVMWKWKTRRAVTGLALVAMLTCGAFVFWPRPDLITLANADRIRVGMSRSEVSAILGPPADYRTRPTLQELLVHLEADENSVWWHTDQVEICLAFNPQGRVTQRQASKHGPDPELSSLDLLCWRVKHRWQQWFPD